MAFIPYHDKAPSLPDGAPPILEFYSNPRGVLALNLARVMVARGDLAAATRELAPFGLADRADVLRYVAERRPMLERRRAA